MESSEVTRDIGQRLHAARVQKNYSLEEASRTLRIRLDYLAALEAGDWDRMPGEVYAQGFLRSFAKLLDLDAEELVALRRTTLPAPAATQAPSRPRTLSTAGHPPRRPISRSVRQRPPRAMNSQARRPANRVVGIVAVLILVFLGLSWLLYRKLPTTAGPAPRPTRAVYTPQTVAPRPTAASPPPQQRGRSQPVPKSAAKPKVQFKGISAGGIKTYTVSQSPVHIVIAFRQACWVRAHSNGQVVIAGSIYGPGKTLHLTGSHSVEVRLGNSGGVVLQVNGQQMGPVGGVGSVQAVQFVAP